MSRTVDAIGKFSTSQQVTPSCKPSVTAESVSI